MAESQVAGRGAPRQLQEDPSQESTLGLVPWCFEGGSKRKTGKSFPGEEIAGVKSLRWQEALSVQQGERRSVWLQAGNGVEKEAGWEIGSGAVPCGASQVLGEDLGFHCKHACPATGGFLSRAAACLLHA